MNHALGLEERQVNKIKSLLRSENEMHEKLISLKLLPELDQYKD